MPNIGELIKDILNNSNGDQIVIDLQCVNIKEKNGKEINAIGYVLLTKAIENVQATPLKIQKEFNFHGQGGNIRIVIDRTNGLDIQWETYKKDTEEYDASKMALVHDFVFERLMDDAARSNPGEVDAELEALHREIRRLEADLDAVVGVNNILMGENEEFTQDNRVLHRELAAAIGATAAEKTRANTAARLQRQAEDEAAVAIQAAQARAAVAEQAQQAAQARADAAIQAQQAAQALAAAAEQRYIQAQARAAAAEQAALARAAEIQAQDAAIQAQQAQADREIEEAQAQAALLQGQLVDAERAAHDASVADRAAAQLQIVAAQAATEQANQQLAELQERSQQERADNERALQEANGNLQRARVEKQQAEAQRDAANREKEEANREKEEAEEQRDAANAAIAAANAAIAAANADKDDAVRGRDAANADAQQIMRDAAAEVEQAKQEKQQADEALANLQLQNAQAESVVLNRARQNVDEANERAASAERKLEAANKKIKETEGQLAQENQRAEARVQELNNQIQTKQQQIERLNKQAADVADANGVEKQNIVRELEAANEALVEAQQEKQQAIASQQQAADERDQVNQVNAALKEKTARLEATLAQLAAANALLNQQKNAADLALRQKNEELQEATAKLAIQKESLEQLRQGGATAEQLAEAQSSADQAAAAAQVAAEAAAAAEKENNRITDQSKKRIEDLAQQVEIAQRDRDAAIETSKQLSISTKAQIKLLQNQLDDTKNIAGQFELIKKIRDIRSAVVENDLPKIKEDLRKTIEKIKRLISKLNPIYVIPQAPELEVEKNLFEYVRTLFTELINLFLSRPVIFKLNSLDGHLLKSIIAEINKHETITYKSENGRLRSLPTKPTMNALFQALFMNNDGVPQIHNGKDKKFTRDTENFVEIQTLFDITIQGPRPMIHVKAFCDRLASFSYATAELDKIINTYQSIIVEVDMLEPAIKLIDRLRRSRTFTRLVDKTIRDGNSSQILTFLKITNFETDDYNQRFHIWFNPEGPPTMMILDYNDDNFPYYLKEQNGPIIANPILSNKREKFQLHSSESRLLERIAPYDYTYLFGKFNEIFPPQLTNRDITERQNMETVIDKVKEGKPLFLIGYGASGSGKTSSLIYFKGTGDGTNKQDGVLIELCKKLIVEGYNKLSVMTKEYFTANQDLIKKRQAGSGAGAGAGAGASASGNLTGDNNDGSPMIYTRGPFNFTTQDGNFILNPAEQSQNLVTFFHTYRKFTIPVDKRNSPIPPNATLGDVLIQLIDTDRLVKATTNNPNSSRSHSVIYITLTGPDKPDANIFVGDFAGVENEFKCDDSLTLSAFLNIKRDIPGDIDTSKLFYSHEMRDQRATEDTVLETDPIFGGMPRRTKDAQLPTVPILDKKLKQEYVSMDTPLYDFEKFNKNGFTPTADDMKRKFSEFDSSVVFKYMFSLFGIQVDPANNQSIYDELTKLDEEKIDEINKILSTIIEKMKSTANIDVGGNFFDTLIRNAIFKIILGIDDDTEIKRTYFPRLNAVLENLNSFYSRAIEFSLSGVNKDRTLHNEYENNELNPDDRLINFKHGKNMDVHHATITTSLDKPHKNLKEEASYFKRYISMDTSKSGALQQNLSFGSKIARIIYEYKKHLKNEQFDGDDKAIGSLIFYHLDDNESGKKDNGEHTLPIKLSFNIDKAFFENLTKTLDIKSRFDGLLLYFSGIINIGDLQELNNDKIMGLLNNGENPQIIKKWVDFMIKFYENIRDKIIETHYRLKYGQNICVNRRQEGLFINHSLEKIRDTIREILFEKNKDVFYPSPDFIDICMDTYCPTHKDCFQIPSPQATTDPSNPPSIIFKDIMEYLKLTKVVFYKDIIVAAFCVFNISRIANNPPPVPYIDINRLKQLYYYKKDQDITSEVITTFKRIAKYPQLSTLKTLMDAVLKMFTTGPSVSVFSDYGEPIQQTLAGLKLALQDQYEHKPLQDLITAIDKHNAASAIGTLEFLDQIAKLTTTEAVCFVKDNAYIDTSQIQDYKTNGKKLYPDPADVGGDLSEIFGFVPAGGLLASGVNIDVVKMDAQPPNTVFGRLGQFDSKLTEQARLDSGLRPDSNRRHVPALTNAAVEKINSTSALPQVPPVSQTTDAPVSQTTDAPHSPPYSVLGRLRGNLSGLNDY